MTDNLGIYIHVPFCTKKCAYCDFYSLIPSDILIDNYLSALRRELKKWGGVIDRPIDTVYIGGGTPSLLNGKVETVLNGIYDSFNILPGAEITAEVNPDVKPQFLETAVRCGVNRISIGVQSGLDEQLKMLGRRHTVADARDCFYNVRKAGIDNISLDVMLCLPGGGIKRLGESLDFICSLEPEHISAYMLKIEEGTKFYIDKSIKLPDDDSQAEEYLYMCDRLEGAGYRHYEISNFSKPGFESRHNLRYWDMKDYLGIGPGAHSLLGGKRFYYLRDIKGFISEGSTQDEGVVEPEKERFMLNMRLSSGFDTALCGKLSDRFYDEIRLLERENLLKFSKGKISLTDKGMLVSNSIITELMELIYEDL